MLLVVTLPSNNLPSNTWHPAFEKGEYFTVRFYLLATAHSPEYCLDLALNAVHILRSMAKPKVIFSAL